MALTDTSRLEFFGFDDPNDVCSSEYRAIYECLSDALASQDETDPDASPSDLLKSSLREFITGAQTMLDKLQSVKLTKSGRLRCPDCKKINYPNLIERGYYLKHDLKAIRGNEIEAEGGISSDFSESGNDYRLECPQCFAEYPLPEEMEINWI